MIQHQEDEVVKQLEYRMVEAFRKSDHHELESLLADEFILTDPNGPCFTKAQFIGLLETGKLVFEQLIIDEIAVRVDEDVAVVKGKATAKGKAAKGVYHGQYGFLDVYVKKEQGWQPILSAVSPEQLAC
jgi:ketosteroid isomerase-like protein